VNIYKNSLVSILAFCIYVCLGCVSVDNELDDFSEESNIINPILKEDYMGIWILDGSLNDPIFEEITIKIDTALMVFTLQTAYYAGAVQLLGANAYGKYFSSIYSIESIQGSIFTLQLLSAIITDNNGKKYVESGDEYKLRAGTTDYYDPIVKIDFEQSNLDRFLFYFSYEEGDEEIYAPQVFYRSPQYSILE